MALRTVLGKSDRAWADNHCCCVQVYKRMMLLLTKSSPVRLTMVEAGPSLVAHDALSEWLREVWALMFAHNLKHMQTSTW